MSLSLLQSYSSAEDEDEDELNGHKFSDDSSLSGEDDGFESTYPNRSAKASAAANSLLPSALHAFSEVSGPPDFLNSSVSNYTPAKDNEDGRGKYGGGRKHRREKKDLPAGAVLEAKPQLVAIRERVSSDEGTQLPSSTSAPVDGKRVISAANPEPKDAADLLRMCLQCGIPKTYSNAKGMVCPVCGDRPPPDGNKEAEKKKGSTVKDKEKSKRMRGQSSHATWKSETEMHLRQQFD